MKIEEKLLNFLIEKQICSDEQVVSLLREFYEKSDKTECLKFAEETEILSNISEQHLSTKLISL